LALPYGVDAPRLEPWARPPTKEEEMISKKNLDRVKYILTELKKSEKNCGACGQFFNKAQADAEGFHLAVLCDANEGN
jgi:hypothetical protein